MSDTATSLVPYLACDPARDAIAFYAAAFGAEEVGPRYEEDGRIGHVELSIGGARLFLSDEYPELGLRSPHALPARSSSLVLFSDRVDVLFARAVELGATVDRPLSDESHGRVGIVIDPFGHRWMIHGSGPTA